MLDIKLFRENPDLIRESEKKRFRDNDYVDKVIEYDEQWRAAQQKLNDLRAERNRLSKAYSEAAKKDKSKLKELQAQSKSVGEQITQLEPEIEELLKTRDEYRYKVGNLIDDSVPISDNEDNNEEVRVWGEKPQFDFEPKSHVELVETIDGVNLETAAKVSGSRFYYLKNDLVFLNLALQRFALDFLVARGFTPFQTPFLIRHEVMKAVSELHDFEDTLYKVVSDEGENLYLIATAEQTLGALHIDEVLDEKTLPRRYAGLSSCFRREAGSHGKDTLGIFRVHEFEKVEQFIFCKAEESKALHEELIGNSEAIYQALGIPYHVISIVSGALNDNGSKKYDLEGWFPAQNTYRELVSCTNCLDYQARKTNTRYGILGNSESYEVCHTLNSTAIATERFMCCILENYQQADGTVRVPDVLVPYMNGKTILGKSAEE